MNNALRTSSLLTVAVLAIALAPHMVAAHGKWIYPIAVTSKENRINFFGTDECGIPSADKSKYETARANPTVLVAGQPITLRYHILNADGGGGLTIKLDTSGGKSNFSVPVKVTKNAKGLNGIVFELPGEFPQDVDVVVEIPPTQCTSPDGVCMLRGTQGAGFGTCAYVKLVAQDPQTGQFVPLSPMVNSGMMSSFGSGAVGQFGAMSNGVNFGSSQFRQQQNGFRFRSQPGAQGQGQYNFASRQFGRPQNRFNFGTRSGRQGLSIFNVGTGQFGQQ